MEDFRFRQFTISHQRSTLKVGTDALLLGALASLSGNEKLILDVGAGCGVIALMLAQRSPAVIDAIEIDVQSALEAGSNFKRSPWSNRLKSISTSFQDYSVSCNNQYDLIVSNPPFFQNCLLPQEKKSSLAKHNQQLGFDEFLSCSSRLLSADGTLTLILPVAESEVFTGKAEEYGLFLYRVTEIIPIENKKANRKVLHFSKKISAAQVHQEITLREKDGKFSEEYKTLTRDFHPEEYFR